VLAKAQKPLIIGGLGAHRAGARKAIEALAERVGGLLATTARGKDLFRGNPRNLGIIGSFSHSIARRMADQADCVIVFGAGLNFLTTSFGTAVPQVPLIQVDAVRANIGRWLNADVGIVGDARLAAEQLLAAVPERSPSEKPFHDAENTKLIADFRPEQDFQPQNTPRTVDMRTLGLELDAILPAERNLVVDGGNFLGIVPYLSVPDPGAFKMISDFASIGLAFGAALGVARARPDRTTVMVVGDGGFLMTMGELETVVREDLPMIVVVMNDCAYGAELHFLKLRQQPVGKSVFPDVDYAPVAAAFGFEAETIRTVEDLHRIAPKLRNPEGPIFLDCKLNADIAAPFMSEFAHFEGH
jgi:thiamine pyrophosphate-dependent acetolactate synthase large subunit-like protein